MWALYSHFIWNVFNSSKYAGCLHCYIFQTGFFLKRQLESLEMWMSQSELFPCQHLAAEKRKSWFSSVPSSSFYNNKKETWSSPNTQSWKKHEMHAFANDMVFSLTLIILQTPTYIYICLSLDRYPKNSMLSVFWGPIFFKFP